MPRQARHDSEETLVVGYMYGRLLRSQRRLLVNHTFDTSTETVSSLTFFLGQLFVFISPVMPDLIRHLLPLHPGTIYPDSDWYNLPFGG
jgi:hypothetical protein